jgi:hypothetical protein
MTNRTLPLTDRKVFSLFVDISTDITSLRGWEVKDLNPVLAVDKSRDEKIANLEKSVSGINDSIEGLKELILGLNKKE